MLKFFQEAPKDKLLVFDVKDGWKPLCTFLKKEIPSVPFPHKNIGGQGVIQDRKQHAVEKQIQKETKKSLFFLSLSLLVIACFCYFTDCAMWQVLPSFVGFLVLFKFFQAQI